MAQINFRIDDDLKKQAESLFNALGMNTTTACMIFIRQSLSESAIPFQIRQMRRPASELDERIRDMEAGRNCHEHELVEPSGRTMRRRMREKALA